MSSVNATASDLGGNIMNTNNDGGTTRSAIDVARANILFTSIAAGIGGLAAVAATGISESAILGAIGGGIVGTAFGSIVGGAPIIFNVSSALLSALGGALGGGIGGAIGGGTIAVLGKSNRVVIIAGAGAGAGARRGTVGISSVIVIGAIGGAAGAMVTEIARTIKILYIGMIDPLLIAAPITASAASITTTGVMASTAGIVGGIVGGAIITGIAVGKSSWRNDRYAGARAGAARAKAAAAARAATINDFGFDPMTMKRSNAFPSTLHNRTRSKLPANPNKERVESTYHAVKTLNVGERDS